MSVIQCFNFLLFVFVFRGSIPLSTTNQTILCRCSTYRVFSFTPHFYRYFGKSTLQKADCVGTQQIFDKKSLEKFVSIKKMLYLCKCYPENNLFTLKKD